MRGRKPIIFVIEKSVRPNKLVELNKKNDIVHDKKSIKLIALMKFKIVFIFLW